jgi:hypothetical protein
MWAALIFAIASAECVLRLLAAPIFALVSAESVLPLLAALIFALVSAAECSTVSASPCRRTR